MLSDRELMTVFEKERMDTERQMEEYEAFTDVQNHLKKLDVKYQEVIALKYFEENAFGNQCHFGQARRNRKIPAVQRVGTIASKM